MHCMDKRRRGKRRRRESKRDARLAKSYMGENILCLTFRRAEIGGQKLNLKYIIMAGRFCGDS